MMQAPVKLGLAPDLVIACFCAERQVSEAALLRLPCQTRAITEQRHQAMWLLHNLTAATLEMIGRLFDRHPSSVWEGISRVSDRCADDPDYRRDLRELREAVIRRATQPPAVAVDARASAARVVAATSVLRDPTLTDADARAAALAILSSIMEAPRG